jgi:hypothetical protein
VYLDFLQGLNFNTLQAAAVMEWTLLALAAYPDKQKKCQEELDAVVGRSRMPTFEDRDNLPYLKATVREALRWRSAVAIGGFSLSSVVNVMNNVRRIFSSGVQHVAMQVKALFFPR